MLSFNQWLKNKNILKEENNLVFFFKKDKTLYGAPESSRLTFARMKNPEDDDADWSKEATFSAYDLEKSSDKPSKNLFGSKDLEKIQVIDQEKAEKELAKKGKKMPDFSDSDEPVDEELSITHPLKGVG